MPGFTTHYGFPFPHMLTEVVDATNWKNLSEAIDVQMTNINTLANQVKFPNVITAVRASSLALTLNTLTDVTYTSTEFQNPAGMWTSGATITIPEAGIYYLSGFARVTSTTVTFNKILFTTTGTGLGTFGPPAAVNHSSSSSAGDWLTNATCLIPATSPNWTAKLQVLMNGTGSPNLTQAGLSIVRLSLI